MTRGILVLVAAAAVVLLAPSGAAARTCAPIIDEGYTPTNIHAVHTSCRTARRVAAKVAKVPSFGGCTDGKQDSGGFQLFIREPCKRKGFRCHGKPLGEGVRVRCSRPGHRFRFDLV
jgi:hypothetical protein